MEWIIFDFGNVVAFLDHHRACRKLADLSANRISEEAIHGWIFRPDGIEEDYDCGRITSAEFIRQIKGQFQIQAADKEVETAWCDIFWKNEAVAALLPRLRRRKIGLMLASNTNELHYNWFKTVYAPVLTNFDVEVLSFRLGFRKPDKRYFQYCLDQAQSSAEGCVFIDDVAANVRAAGDLGIHGIQYSAECDLPARLRELGVEL